MEGSLGFGDTHGTSGGSAPSDFSVIRGKRREQYFKAVQAGLDHDYGSMRNMFGEVIKRTLLNRSI